MESSSHNYTAPFTLQHGKYTDATTGEDDIFKARHGRYTSMYFMQMTLLLHDLFAASTRNLYFCDGKFISTAELYNETQNEINTQRRIPKSKPHL